MTEQEKEQLKLEIDRIFESGANELRIFEMIVNFINRRSEVNNNFILADVSKSANTDEYNKDYKDGWCEARYSFSNHMLDEVTLSDSELIDKCKKWITKLCHSGGKAWCLRVPVDFKNDPDILFTALIKRYEAIWNIKINTNGF